VGSAMVIYRDTPKSAPLVDFVNGSRITEANLDKVAQQGTFIGAEQADLTVDALRGSQEAAASAEQARVSAAAAAADRTQTGLDRTATGADRTQTGLDRTATGADRTQTGLDRTAAEGSAGTATTQAGIATTKAGEALASANTATTQAGNALTSANNAAASYDSFDDRYLGPKAAEPILDNDGAALLTGALYWDTTIPGMRAYTGTAWTTLPAATAGAVANTPAGDIAATTVQAAINELDAEKAKLNGDAAVPFSVSALTASIGAILPSINGGQLAGMRNRIINGACDIAQRGSFVASLNTGGYGGPDRFYAGNSGAGGQFTQAASTLTFGGLVKNTIRQTVNTGTTAFTAGNYWHGIDYKIEGFNAHDLKGKPVVVSFIFNTNLTGTYSVALRDGPTTTSYVTSFSATANTPVKVTVAIPAIPLTATVPNSNTLGLNISVGFQNQADYQTATLNAWQAANKLSASGATIWAATAGNFIELTELQLEEGTVATPFERRSYGTELALCQRYATKISGEFIGAVFSATIAGIVLPLGTTMRTSPALNLITAGSLTDAGGTAIAVTGTNAVVASAYTIRINLIVASGLVAGNSTLFTGGVLLVESEL
jgi:hypothetical protein